MAKEIISETGQPNWFKRSNLEKYYQVETDQKPDYPESWSAAADDYEVAEDLI
mgnify:FL=1|tara:strand:+ start:257 stop:415 length:159 start_codon:yes stop_codon:yes gene_type:complete